MIGRIKQHNNSAIPSPHGSICVHSSHSSSIGGELAMSNGGRVFSVYLLTHWQEWSNVIRICVYVREG